MMIWLEVEAWVADVLLSLGAVGNPTDGCECLYLELTPWIVLAFRLIGV